MLSNWIFNTIFTESMGALGWYKGVIKNLKAYWTVEIIQDFIELSIENTIISLDTMIVKYKY